MGASERRRAVGVAAVAERVSSRLSTSLFTHLEQSARLLG
jgi:hypothetical protein